ncbi:MAG TPA: tetratricopeptide repeat protein, partial [Candidatus Angelobacter sp.]|nr:tetratricopeptide repeat protein [Candidatus Angelobacter sp.]
TDFGLASESDATTAVLHGGTPTYMAPEIWEGKKPSAASDIYSLGVVLYEMVCGQPPVGELSPSAGTNPLAPSKLLQRNGRKWDKIILPCLAAEPQERPQNAGELLAVLNRKPLYRKPVAAVIIFGVLAIGSALWRPVVAYFRPADIRLALLPADAPVSFKGNGREIVQGIGNRIKLLRPINATTVSVIGPSERVHTPKDAKTLLRANRALQITLQPDGQDLIVHESLTELSTLTHLRDFTGRYAPANMVDIPAALTSAVAPSLGLRTDASEAIPDGASQPYIRAMNLLDHDQSSFDGAIPLLQEAVRLAPHSPLPLASLVEALVQKYRASNDKQWLRDANETVSRAQSLNPDSIAVLLATGRLDFVQGNYEKAFESYARAEELAPSNTEVLLRLAAVYNAQNRQERAIECYRRAVGLAPQYFKIYKEFGRFYYAHGQYVEAAEQFQKAIDRFPADYEAYANMAAALNDMQEDEKAEEALKKSLAFKETAQAWNSLGAIKAYQRDDTQALTFYRHALAQSKNNFIYLMNAADSSRRLGQVKQARIYYRRSMDIASAELVQDFRNGFVRVYVGYLAARLGQRKRAEDEILEALQSFPKDKTVIRRTILTYEALANREKAMAIAATAPSSVLRELNRQPDMAEFSKDPRFKVLMAKD